MPKPQPAKSTEKPKKTESTKSAKSVSQAAAAETVDHANGENQTPHVEKEQLEDQGLQESIFTMTDDGKAAAADALLTPFLRRQKERLIHLRDNMLDSMSGVAKDTLRSRAEGSEASAFGMHQADAGSDAYDRDFALSLLSQEQDALYEIEEAIKRIDVGTYGNCEMSGKAIAHARLEAIPFTRYTVECQSQLEKQNKVSRSRVPVTSLFGLTEGEDSPESEEEEPATDTKE